MELIFNMGIPEIMARQGGAQAGAAGVLLGKVQVLKISPPVVLRVRYTYLKTWKQIVPRHCGCSIGLWELALLVKALR